MSSFPTAITPEQAELIRTCALFFVASADPRLAEGPDGSGPVNVSPKGGVTLHMLSENRVAYLDTVGSGNETARHAAGGGPVTVMVCSFDADAAIVRLYGHARAVPFAEAALAAVLKGGARPPRSGRPHAGGAGRRVGARGRAQGRSAPAELRAPAGDRDRRRADDDELRLRRTAHGGRARASTH